MQGIAVSPGIAIAKVHLKKDTKIKITETKISDNMIDKEIERLHYSLNQAKKELIQIKKDTSRKLGKKKAEIFEAHLMLLDDPELIPAIEAKIKNENFNTETAVDKIINYYIAIFKAMKDEYMKERGADIKDVGQRIINILTDQKKEPEELKEKVIIVAKDLNPSDIASLDPNKVLAFVTRDGSRTSHSAIIARSLGIPTVVGLGKDLLTIKKDDKLIVDGNEGKVIINPDSTILKKYQNKLKKYQNEKERLFKYKNQKAVTKNGEEIRIVGNIGNLADVDPVLAYGGEGIGLFRTEFLYMNRKNLPTEEEQFNVFKEVAKKIGDKPLIIRTIDIGGDKNLPYLNLPQEMNPFLGYRAIRICLDQKEIFKPHLKAILRASKYGNIKMMYPMISSLEELKAANEVLTIVKKELEEEGKEYNQKMEIGIMIEIPAAAIITDILAKEVDFFSIGTNDLIQYTIAVDRTNEKIAKMYNPYHPAVLRLIKQIIENGHKEGIWVGMCGETANNEHLFPFLLGTGLDEFSINPTSILRIKALLSKWTKKEAKKVVDKVLNLKTGKEVKDFLSTLI